MISLSYYGSSFNILLTSNLGISLNGRSYNKRHVIWHMISPASFVVDRVGTNLIKRIMNY